MKNTLRYLTLDELMASVESDMDSFADNGMVNRGRMIKIIRRVNEDLGLKINQEKEALVEIKNHKGDLPEDFYKLQLTYLCSQAYYAHAPGEIFGTHFEERSCDELLPVDVECKRNVCFNECGGCYWVAQRFKEKIVRYKVDHNIRVTRRSSGNCSLDCPNLSMRQFEYEIDIENGEVTTGFKDGNLYVNYLSDMSDKDGNLLILDHPLVRDYYEYACKKHLLETWMLNNDADVTQKLAYFKNELYEARIRALNFTNTVEYSEIQSIFKKNRAHFYNRLIQPIEP